MTGTLTLYKKTDRVLTFTYPTGTDLNGDTILFTVKRKAGGAEDDSDAIIKTETTVSSSTNVAQIAISDTLSNVPVGKYVGDIKRVTAGGEITGYSAFDVEIVNTVTQRGS